jgi:Protein of unknown function (DUF3703)
VSSIDAELGRARGAGDPWPMLERAHILSQPWAWQHTRVHAVMLRVAVAQRDRKEIVGQVVRVAVAGPGSLTGRFPLGNTGRTTMALTETADVPPDLAEQLDAAGTPSN